MEIVSTKAVGESKNCNTSDKERLSKQLFEAVISGDVASAQQLIMAGADIKDSKSAATPYLFLALCADNLEMVKLLLSHGANSNVQDEVLNTPLSISIARGNVELAETLIDNGTDINGASGMDNDTPLMTCVREEQEPILRLLLSHGANPYAKNYDGENLFAFAKRWEWALPPELVETPKEDLLKALGRHTKSWFHKK